MPICAPWLGTSIEHKLTGVYRRVTQRNRVFELSARPRVWEFAAGRKAHLRSTGCARNAAPRERLSDLFDFFFYLLDDAVRQRRVGQGSRHLLAIGDHPVQKVR